MLFYHDLEEIIFTRHEILDHPDELIIISGYLGASPMENLSDINLKSTVIGGMYSSGMNPRLWEPIKNLVDTNNNIELFFSNIQIHSKIYIWKRKNKILSGLIGSANFSTPGLRTDYRECLAEVTSDSFNNIQRYYEYIKKNCRKEPKINIQKNNNINTIDFNKKDNINVDLSEKNSHDLPLYSHTKNKGNYIPEKSGLNWGLANAHVSEGDAYIRISKEMIKNSENMIKPYDPNYINPKTKKRLSPPVELIWDDGFIMGASLEGKQELNNLAYPKQITSYSLKSPMLNGKKITGKSILGRYLRKRLNVPIDKKINMEDLKRYGRDYVTLYAIDEGVYYADFSV